MNLKRSLLALPLAGLIGLSACTVPEPAPNDTTIAGVLVSDTSGDDRDGFDDNWYDFDVVTQLVLKFDDLVAAASNEEAELTVFAPNDRAFQVLVHDLTGKWIKSEQDVFDAVDGLGDTTVKTVLTYHIVPAKIAAADALAADGAELDTLQGGKIGVKVVSPALAQIRLVDLDPTDTDPGIVFSKFNVGGKLNNGYIHGLSLVLRPADL